MKKLLFSAAVLSAVGLLNAQESPTERKEKAVGINEERPQATLDVNGDFRVQKIDECKDCKWVLVQDANGMVQKLPISDFTISGGSAANPVGGTATFASLSDETVYVYSFNYGGRANYQGVVNSTGIPVNIEYNASGTGNIEERIISAEGNPNLKLKIPTTAISEGTGTITALLYSDVNYNVPQLSTTDSDQNTYEKNVAAFKVRVKGVAEPATITLKAGGGIPDRLFGEETNGELEHQFVYLPVEGPDGKTWLNNNLGANYADISKLTKGKRDITRQATFKGDYDAYGSLFQWQRKADGHELIDWEKNKSKYEGTSTRLARKWVDAETKLFITSPDAEWISEELRDGPHNLWTSSGSNNPCPDGFHVPTRAELEELVSAMGLTPTAQGVYFDTLRLVAVDYRSFSSGNFWPAEEKTGTWTSTYSDRNRSFALDLFRHKFHPWGIGSGNPVRCVKN